MSHIADFYRNPNKDFSTFFDSKIETIEIAEIRKEINSLQLKINHKMENLQNLYGTMYGSGFVPNDTKIFVKYIGRSNEGIFSLDTLKEAEPGKDDNIINLDGKEGHFTYLIGYSYDMGAAILRTCEYKVSAKCDSIKVTPLYEYVVSLLEDKPAMCYNYKRQETSECANDRGYISDALRDIKAKEFLNEMYGIDRNFGFSLSIARMANFNNKNFETIIKTCPLEIIKKAFDARCTVAGPMHNVFSLDKAVYEEACQYGEKEPGFLTFFIDAFDYYNKIDQPTKAKFNFDKTNKQYYDYAVKAWNLKKDMDFYGVCDTGNFMLWATKLFLGKDYYCSHADIFNQYYPFGKFINYIATESVNQGYSRVSAFVSELKDYINMAQREGSVPTLYSSYLKLTHDIASRNARISVSSEDEKIFKEKYEDIKGYVIGDYTIIAPSCTNDVKAEGNKLNHCVASYINRVIKGECLIMFMRLTKALSESLVTLEIEGGRIAQARGMSNRNVTPEEHDALIKFAKKACLEIDE